MNFKVKMFKFTFCVGVCRYGKLSLNIKHLAFSVLYMNFFHLVGSILWKCQLATSQMWIDFLYSSDENGVATVRPSAGNRFSWSIFLSGVILTSQCAIFSVQQSVRRMDNVWIQTSNLKFLHQLFQKGRRADVMFCVWVSQLKMWFALTLWSMHVYARRYALTEDSSVCTSLLWHFLLTHLLQYFISWICFFFCLWMLFPNPD